ncbi:Uncharacterised protein [uncultured archaeon]|nr:Uncharacterised protein [uncultured archaeon]
MEQREINDLLLSWVTLSFAFAWNFNSLSVGDLFAFMTNFTVMLLAVGAGFILHELAHKYVAIHYGCHAEFVAWQNGLLLALGLAIFTNGAFVFAAPGAVYIFGNKISTKENGIISLAGPATNIGVALMLLAASAFLGLPAILGMVAAGIISINLFLAVFNLIPVPPLDGSKVFMWNKGIWLATMAAAAGGLYFLPAIRQAVGLP